MKTPERITEAEYLAELESVLCAKPPDGAFTASDVSARTGVDRRRVADRLEKDVVAGLLTTGTFVHRGRKTRFYWIE